MKKRNQEPAKPEQAGFSVPGWCNSVGICRAGYYTLPEKIKPASVRIGGRRIISESPKAWLDRVASMQKEAA